MAQTPPRRGATGALSLSLIGFFAIFSTTISKSPVLPLFVKSLNGSDAVIGLISAISPLAGILFSFPVGLLADRLGRKRLLVAASLVFVLAPPLYLVVHNAFWLIPIRFFHGIGTAILGPVASAMILSAYPDRKGEKLGLYSSATLVGRTLAPLLGGAIISLFNYRSVYGAAFLLSVPVLVLSLALRPDNGDPAAVRKVGLADFWKSLGEFMKNRRLLGTSLVEMATFFCYGVMETYLPIYLSGQGVPAYQIGLVFSLQVVSIALTKPLFGFLADRVDRRVQILFGIVLTAAFIALIPLFHGALAVGLVAVLFGLAMSVSTVATSTYVAEVAREESLGASLGALSAIMDIGQSSGPFIAGVIITATAIGAGFVASAGVSVLSALVFLVLTFRTPVRKQVPRK
ncbi:MAG TPA: MFS transporter [Spirochaetia bacterium]|nr:MFS transporter [Spirochaetia bacterium]